MKKILVVVLSAAIGLGGCATTGGITPQTVTNAITAIQTATTQACGFLPTAATVSGIVAALFGGGALATETAIADIATKICTAVAPVKAGTAAGKTVRVAGVVVHGRFVR